MKLINYIYVQDADNCIATFQINWSCCCLVDWKIFCASRFTIYFLLFFSMVLGLFDSAVPYKDQHYNKLKKQCISKGELFVDPIFPPDSKSLFYSKVEKDIVWKRPGVSIKKKKSFE